MLNNNDKKRIKDLAALTGVSPATVSNALNNRKGVSEETRERIIKAAAAIGYQKSGILDYSQIIRLVIVSNSKNVESYSDFIYKMIDGVNIQGRKAGYDVLVVRISGSELGNYLMSPTNAAGTIVLASEILAKEFDEIACMPGHPVIMLDNYCLESAFEMISSNNEGGFYTMTRYLIENGHRRIGLLASKTVLENFLRREMGYKHALQAFGLEYNPKYRFELSFPLNDCFEMLNILKEIDIKADDFPTAFVALNDAAAVNAIKAFTEFGLRVPDDVSIIGFDNTPYCQFSIPALSSYDSQFGMLATTAVDRLVAKIQTGDDSHLLTVVPGKLIERESVKQLN